MVMQYKLKGTGRWKKYPGKDKIEGSVSKYDFRVLNESKTKFAHHSETDDDSYLN